MDRISLNSEMEELSSLKSINHMIKIYPTATEQSNNELLAQYRNGNRDAQDLLIKTNLRLVVSQANYYRKHMEIESYELVDIIQEGLIGLCRAVDTYDDTLGKAKFSTYAITCIRNNISLSLKNSDKNIRRPKNLIVALKAYQKILAMCQANNTSIPSDYELCKDLNITANMLKLIREDYKLNTYSLNAPAFESSIEANEDLELGDVIVSAENGYDQLLDEMSNRQILFALKSAISPYHYYILYHRFLRKDKVTQKDLAEKLCLTSSGIGSSEKVCLQQLKAMISSHGKISDWEIDYDIQRDIDKVDVEPMNPEYIVRYLFFRDILTEEERKVFKQLIIGIYRNGMETIANELRMNTDDYGKVYTLLQQKIRIENVKLREVYQCFKKTILSQYKSKIFDIDLDGNLENVTTNVKYVSQMWDGLSYQQVIDFMYQNNIEISHHMNELFERYFVGDSDKLKGNSTYIQKAEKEINAILFGFSKKNELPIKGLYEAFIKNKSEFTEEQYFCFMINKFHKASKKLMKQKYPHSIYLYGNTNLFQRLEFMYFNITDYKEFNFTKAKYESVRDKFLMKVSKDKVKVLDLFYGVGTQKHSIQEVADVLGVSYEVAHSEIHKIRDSALSLYLEKSRTKRIEERYYIPYILDETINLSEKSRMMLRQFLIEKKDYAEIAKINGITTRKVSSYIASGILQIDFYRFGILKVDTCTKEESIAILESSSFTGEERNIIEMMLDGKTREEMMQSTGLTFQRVAYILDKFYKTCRKEKVANVQIDENDIKREVCAHISERVLNDNERLLLAKLYGILCEVNPEGRKYSEQEFRLENPTLSKKYCKVLKEALNTVRSKKAGLIRASLAYMSRKDLELSLMDPRIPISVKERELLNYSFELNGYPYKSLNELSEIFGDKSSVLKEKVERIFVKIYKYENDELPASLSFECDVAPCLRYFTKADQAILEDCYDKELTQEQIAKKHGLTSSQVEKLLFRLNAHLYDLINDTVNGFDFNYFWSVVGDKDLPFYGDIEKAKRVFYLYYEERMTIKEIVDFLKLDCSEAAVSRTISNLMIAVLKRKEGIKKVKCYTPDEIMDYYLRNSDSMTEKQREEYNKYFKSVQEESKATKLSVITIPKVPSQIVLDLTKERNQNVFSIGVTKKETVLEIIRKYKNQLSKTTLNTLLREYGITQRELMSGSEQMKVLRFLSEVNCKNKVLSFHL